MLATKLAPFREKLQDYFSEEITIGRSKSSLTLFSLLLLGKFISEATPELARETARRYQMSNAEADWVQNLVQENRAVQEMAETFDRPDRRAIYLYFKNSGEAGVSNVLLFLAKCLATPGKLSGSEWDHRLRIVETLLTAWWVEHREVINPRLLLNGRDLQKEFGLPPGAMIGQLLAELKEAQAAGTVLTLDDARAFITKAIPIPGESDAP
jgi:hypothetical protein